MNKVIAVLLFVSWAFIRIARAFFEDYVELVYFFHSCVIGSAAVYVWRYNNFRDSLLKQSEEDLEIFKRHYEGL